MRDGSFRVEAVSATHLGGWVKDRRQSQKSAGQEGSSASHSVAGTDDRGSPTPAPADHAVTTGKRSRHFQESDPFSIQGTDERNPADPEALRLTPRTDKESVTFENGFPVLNCSQVVNADFARTLERELLALRESESVALRQAQERIQAEQTLRRKHREGRRRAENALATAQERVRELEVERDDERVTLLRRARQAEAALAAAQKEIDTLTLTKERWRL